MPTSLPQSLLKEGFKEPSPNGYHRRLLLSTQGLEGTGKTDLIFSAPDPIALFDIDIGTEGVVEKYKGKKLIGIKQIRLSPDADQDDYKASYEEFKKSFARTVRNKDVRTIAIDSASDLWDLIKLAKLGVLNPQKKPEHTFDAINSEYRAILREVLFAEHYPNLILTHKMKKQYVAKARRKANGETYQSSEWEGNYERHGFSDREYIVQANIEQFYDRETKQFGYQIEKCRPNGSLVGDRILGSELTTFPEIAAYMTGSSPEDWK